MKIFVAGEGSDEIGDWAKERLYRSSPSRGGIVEALLRKTGTEDWEIADGCPWRSIRKYKAGRGMRDAEIRNVLGVALQARESSCEVIVFVRDRDGSEDRELAIDAGIERAREGGAFIAGGVAVEQIDAWVLALLGDQRAESHRNPKAVLKDNHFITSGEQKVLAVEAGNVATAGHAPSLRTWMSRISAILR